MVGTFDQEHFIQYELTWMDDDCTIIDVETISIPKVTINLVQEYEMAQSGMNWFGEHLYKGRFAIPAGATQFSLMKRTD